jgi:hypothetical protein
VLFALSLTVMVVAVGLVIDAGNAFANRRDAQNTADLAALAGTKAVTDYYTTVPQPALATAGLDVYDAIQANTLANGCRATDATPCTWSADYVDRNMSPVGTVTASGAMPSGAQGVQVKIARQPATFFLGVIGQTKWDVGTSAMALVAKPGELPAGQVLPIGTNPPVPFDAGKEYVLANTADDKKNPGPGNFGWLSWTGQNATGILATSICTPNNPALSFPVDIVGEPGKHNGDDVRACLDKWIASGATVLIPVYDSCEPCNGNNASYHVTGMAAFVLTGYDGSGPAIDNLKGIYQGYSSSAPVQAGYQGPPSAGDPTYFLGLVQ